MKTNRYVAITTIFAVTAPFLSSNFAQAQEIITLDHTRIMPLSPEAAALHNAINYPLEGNTGAPDISIPLYTVTSGNITIPIVLRYSTCNAKVDWSTAPNVAFGWTIDVGGSINRVIKGKPDEAFDMYPVNTGVYFNQLTNYTDQKTISRIYGWTNETPYDSEYDEFVFNMPQSSGTFYISKNGSKYDGYFSPTANYKIASTKSTTWGGMNMFYSIDLLDDHGTRYQYGRPSASSTESYIDFSRFSVTGADFASGWALRKIEDDTGNAVSFTYTSSGSCTNNTMQNQWYVLQDQIQGYYIYNSEAADSYMSSFSPQSYNTTEAFDYSLYASLLPSTIDFGEGTVSFTVQNRMIKEIVIKDASGVQVRKITFTTATNNISDKFPLLSTITIRDAANTVVQTYSMAYNNTAGSTINVSKVSCDWWGYFNGTTSQTAAFLPDRSFSVIHYPNDYQTTVTLGNGGNRTPNSTYIQHNILKSITYPSGGKTEFLFEPNAYNKERGTNVTTGVGPGLRIKEIAHKDKDGTLLRKYGYTYGNGNIAIVPANTNRDTYTNYSMQVMENSATSALGFICSIRNRRITPKYCSDISGAPENVVYDSVTETYYNDNTAAGKTVNKFQIPSSFGITNSFANAYESGSFNLSQYHIATESLSYNTSYKESSEIYNGSGTLVQKKTYLYSQSEKAELLNMGLYRLLYYESPADNDPSVLFDYAAINRLNGQNVEGAVPLYYYFYTSSKGVRYPSGEQTETYSSDGTLHTEKTLTYNLSKAYHYPIKSNELRSDGKSIEYLFTYPFDYTSNAVMDSLVSRGIISPVIEQQQYVRNSASSTTLIDTYHRDFASFSNTTRTFYRPAAIWYATGGNTLEKRITYSAYDTRGNIRSALYDKDINEHYLWSYAWHHPIALVQGPTWNELTNAVSQSSINTLCAATSPSDAAVNNMLLNIRSVGGTLAEGATHRLLYGASSLSTAASVKTSFGYDSFQRLESIKDNGGYLRSFISYADGTAAGASYVRANSPDTAATALSSVAMQNRRTVTTYYDGIYRNIQQVSAYASPSSKDMITFTQYDAYGNASAVALPYEASAGTGAYRSSAQSEQSTFYNTLYSGEGSYARQRTTFEASPLCRPVEEYLPGSGSYATSGGATTRHTYGTNTASQVKTWSVSSSGIVSALGYYPAGALETTTTTDCDGRVITVFKDLQGRTVESRSGSSIQLITSYVYDDLGQLIAVVTPKAQATSTIISSLCYVYNYDPRGRKISTTMPDGGTTEYVYDANNRLVASRDARQNAAGQWHFYRYDRLGREVYNGITSSNATAAALRSAYATAAVHESLVSGGAIYGYSNTAQSLAVTINDVLTITYYDGYDYPNAKAFVAAGSAVGQDTSFTPATAPKGAVTGSKVKILDGNETSSSALWLTGSHYYNGRGERVQSVEEIYCGTGTLGTARTSTSYRQQGEISVTKEEQTTASQSTALLLRHNYDQAGREKSISYSLDGTTWAQLSASTYDAAGRLLQKSLGASVQTLDYGYDIRNRMTSINSPGSLGTDKFAAQMVYEGSQVSGSTPQYGGNISAVQWQQSGGAVQTYIYNYDSYSRLTNALHSGGNSETGMTYDTNGNLLSLTRGGTSAQTLSYSYLSGNNRLSAITSSGSAKSYAYDASGNMTTDGIRGMTLQYNSIDMPKRITKSSDYLDYIYDASGRKLAVKMNGTLQNCYCGSMIYNGSGTIDHIVTPEGTLRKSGSSYITQYSIKDHLGSTRAVVDASGSLLQSTDYYAFGLPFSTTNTDKNRYLYNGKEIENNTIGGTQLATLDYGARHYDPIIARWFTTDPMAEKYYSLTPYNYCGNNPMRFVDPDGKDYGIKFNKKNKTITVSAVYYTNSQSKASLSRAIKVFNNRTEDKFIYKNEEYSIIYNLSEKVYADPVEHVKLYDKKKGHDDYNSYVISKPDSNNRKGYITTGSTKDHRQIKVSENYKDNPTTGAHEIGHTLNFDHTDKGLMTPTNSDELRDKNPTQENINNMIDKKLTKGILESLINLFKKNEK